MMCDETTEVECMFYPFVDNAKDKEHESAEHEDGEEDEHGIVNGA